MYSQSIEEVIQKYVEDWMEWYATPKWFDKVQNKWYRFETAEELPEPELLVQCPRFEDK